MDARIRPLRLLPAGLAAVVAILWMPAMVRAEPLVVTPRWEAAFASDGGGILRTTCVGTPDGTMLVTVVLPGANPRVFDLKHGSRQGTARMIAHDPVSRLCFLQVDSPVAPRPAAWLESMLGMEHERFEAHGPAGVRPCRGSGWVRQVRGKVLPLGLLRVRFDGEVPPPGTPLMDASGNIAAILFQEQPDGGGRAYAIPADAMHRVSRDLARHQRLIRGWIGIALETGGGDAEITRVLPESPAAEAGIRAGDVLRRIGSRDVAGYPDAVDAFFYLVPGQAVDIRLVRDNATFDVRIVPVEPPADADVSRPAAP